MSKELMLAMRSVESHFQPRLERGLLSEQRKEWMRELAKKHPDCFAGWRPHLDLD